MLVVFCASRRTNGGGCAEVLNFYAILNYEAVGWLYFAVYAIVLVV